MVGERWFSTLPPQYQQILIEECNRAAIANAAQILGVAADFERRMVAAGMQIHNVNKAPFVAAAERAYEELGFLALRNQIWSEIGRR
jgi:TRAP-type C4-dicarboxylate transport system substrate-binding protein